MKHLLSILFIVCTYFSLSAQTTVQWATQVEEVSSEFTELENSSRQALLKPNILPAGGSNPNAWRPFKPNTTEYIKVGFELPMPISK